MATSRCSSLPSALAMKNPLLKPPQRVNTIRPSSSDSGIVAAADAGVLSAGSAVPVTVSGHHVVWRGAARFGRLGGGWLLAVGGDVGYFGVGVLGGDGLDVGEQFGVVGVGGEAVDHRCTAACRASSCSALAGMNRVPASHSSRASVVSS